MENVWVGTDLKIKTDLSCDGFSMADDDFDIDVYWGNQVQQSFDKSDLIVDEGDYYMLLSTEGMSGTVAVVATLYVPDTDFTSGTRKEVIKEVLFRVKRL